jgi:hypothetical protein
MKMGDENRDQRSEIKGQKSGEVPMVGKSARRADATVPMIGILAFSALLRGKNFRSPSEAPLTKWPEGSGSKEVVKN